MMKIAGSGFICQRHGSADPDPHLNGMVPDTLVYLKAENKSLLNVVCADEGHEGGGEVVHHEQANRRQSGTSQGHHFPAHQLKAMSNQQKKGVGNVSNVIFFSAVKEFVSLLLFWIQDAVQILCDEVL
jgi:hypothetical protein